MTILHVFTITSGVLFVALGFCGHAQAGTEQPDYQVEHSEGDFEVRMYPEQIVAETRVQGSMERAGNQAFRPLFRFISGANRSQTNIAMTAPVGQEKATGEKIAMTAPVGQMAASDAGEASSGVDSSGDAWIVTFMMPSSYTMDTVPEPSDDAVQLRVIPPHRAASVTYSGRWHQRGYEEHLSLLREWINENGYQEAGTPIWARYNSPMTPWFLRRNEVIIPIKSDAD